MNMSNPNTEIARQIVECFEDILDAKGITIPCSSEREENERNMGDGSPIYGTEYGDLCELIVSILDDCK